MRMICLDMEGVLVPEIWIGLAEKTGIDELRVTTRDEPDYDRLMRRRLAILREHRIQLADMQAVAAALPILPGAREFMDSLRAKEQVVVLSDTFRQVADPLVEKLGRPTLFCNDLVVDNDGWITDYRLRQPDGKRRAVEAFVSLGFEVVAAGDSFNDLAMILAAGSGALFRPPQAIRDQYPDIPVFEDYRDFSQFLLYS